MHHASYKSILFFICCISQAVGANSTFQVRHKNHTPALVSQDTSHQSQYAPRLIHVFVNYVFLTSQFRKLYNTEQQISGVQYSECGFVSLNLDRIISFCSCLRSVKTQPYLESIIVLVVMITD